MVIENFTPGPALLGGLLIGLSASLLLGLQGRVAGISGIAKGILFDPLASERQWRLWFILGLIFGGTVIFLFQPSSTAAPLYLPPWQMVLGGLLVGFGTALGNGCTSGHGICGLSRRSLRSLAAVMTFMGVGFVTVLLMNIFGLARF